MPAPEMRRRNWVRGLPTEAPVGYPTPELVMVMKRGASYSFPWSCSCWETELPVSSREPRLGRPPEVKRQLEGWLLRERKLVVTVARALLPAEILSPEEQRSETELEGTKLVPWKGLPELLKPERTPEQLPLRMLELLREHSPERLVSRQPETLPAKKQGHWLLPQGISMVPWVFSWPPEHCW